MEFDRFKESFKYFKSKNPAPDLSLALEIDGDKNKDVLKRLPVDLSLLDPSLTSILRPQWDVFTLVSCPGLILIRNPFTPVGQRYFISRCLQDYARHPNPTNLHLSSQESSWWETLNLTTDEKTHKKLQESMRWTTLGYHHDWDTKIYNEKMRNEFPEDLKYLIQEIAKVLKYEKYEPEAAIVNFYPLNTTLAGHTDHSEFCNEPLFSISFGQSAIFLIGGKTKDIKPSPLLLKSGDICIFTNESRLSYHAVPKILKTQEKMWCNVNEEGPDTIPNHFDQNTFSSIKKDQETWRPFENYVSTCRININVRQVYKNEEKPKDS